MSERNILAILTMALLVAAVPYVSGDDEGSTKGTGTDEERCLEIFSIDHGHTWINYRGEMIRKLMIEGASSERGPDGEELHYVNHLIRTRGPITEYEVSFEGKEYVHYAPTPWIPPTIPGTQPELSEWEPDAVKLSPEIDLTFLGKDGFTHVYGLKIQPVAFDGRTASIFKSIRFEYITGPEIGTNSLSSRKPLGDIDYLIITDHNLTSELGDFARLKASKGILTSIVTTDEIYDIRTSGDKASRIRRYVQSMESSFDLDYLLLVGDHDLVPTRLTYNPYPCNMMGVNEPPDFASDSYYACVDAGTSWNTNNNRRIGEHSDLDDVIPDLAVGRIAANDRTVLSKIMDSLVDRELNFTTGGHENVPVYIAGDPNMNPGSPTSVMDHFWETYGEDVFSERDTMYYDGTGNLTFSTSSFMDMMEENHQFMGYYAHGKFDNIPDLVNENDIASIGTDNPSGLFFAMACVNGMFDDGTRGNIGGTGDCLAETMTETPGKGTLGYIAASRLAMGAIDTSYSGDAPGLMEDYWRAVEKAKQGRIPMTSGDIYRDAQTSFAGSFYPFPNSMMDGSHRTFLEYNLFGDPEAPLIIDEREELSLDWSLSPSGDLLEAEVTSSNGSAVPFAKITLFRHGELGRVFTTDAGGNLSVSVPPSNGGRVQLSAYKEGFNPNSTFVELPDRLFPLPLYDIDPEEPDGLNGYYLTSPGVTMYGDEPVSVEYSWDGGEPLVVPGPITSAAAEGNHTLRFRVFDRAEHHSEWTEVVLLVDTVPPSVGIRLDPEVPDGNGGVYITAPQMTILSDEPLTDPRYSIDGGPYLPYIGPLTLEEGEHRVEVRAMDPAGNTGNATAEVKVDLSFPDSYLDISHDPEGKDGYYLEPPTVRIMSGSPDMSRLEYRWDEAEWMSYSTPMVVDEGIHVLHYRSVDTAGNVEPEREHEFRVDPTGPQLIISVSPEEPDGINGFHVTPPTVEISSGDEVSYVLREAEDAPVDWKVALPYSSPFRVTDGEWELFARAEDPAGNLKTGEPIRFMVDSTPPEITWKVEPMKPNGMNGYYILPPRLIVGSTSPEDKIEYRMPGGEWTAYEGKIDIPDGINVVQMRSLDRAGNEYTASTGEIKVDSTVPGLEVIFPVKGAVYGPGSMYLRWNGTDNVSILSYRIKIDGGSFVDLSGASEYLVEGLEHGYHSIMVEAKDEAGNTMVERTEFHVDAVAPEIKEISPSGGDNPVNSRIEVIFSEAMDKSSVTVSVNAEEAVIEWKGNSLEATPSRELEHGRNYTVVIDGRDAVGNEMEIHTHTFSTTVINISEPVEDEEGYKIPLGLLAAVAAGSLVLIVTIMAVFIFLKKRRS